MKKILLCLDNSPDSTAGIDLGVELAIRDGGALTGLHVYAARLHNERFRQMEPGLPAEYQEEDELRRQRSIHDDLITRGLEIISDSYMTVLHAKAATSGISARGLSREGRNFEEIVREADEGGYDLVVLGALGLGKTERSVTGSVCERVTRRTGRNTLIIKEGHLGRVGHGVVVAVDGSPRSFGALQQGMGLARAFDCALHIISVYDPDFHYAAFRSIAGVLTEEASRLFRFEEQKALHNNIIDRGLARIYRTHLETAVAIARGRGMEPTSELLSGKPTDRVLEYVERQRPRFLVIGKTGVHGGKGLDMGSLTENCLRYCPSNVLITTDEYLPEARTGGPRRGPQWTDEAEQRLSPIPPFARSAARATIEEAALDAGITTITPDFLERFRKDLGF